MVWLHISICFALFFNVIVQGVDHAKDIEVIGNLRHLLVQDMPGFQSDYEYKKNVFDLGNIIVQNLEDILTLYRKDGSINANKTLTAASEIEDYNKKFQEYIGKAWKAFFKATGLVSPSYQAIAALDNMMKDAS